MGDDVLAAIWTAALGRQSTPLVSVIVERNHQYRLTDDQGTAGSGDPVLEGLPEGPELLVLAISIYCDLLNELIQGGLIGAARFQCRVCLPHDKFLPYCPPQ
jgi:hypothetical protein